MSEEDLVCPVCKSLLRDPFVSACGHTFCYICIAQHLGQRKSCPICNTYTTLDLVFPNFTLQRLASLAKTSERRQHASIAEQIQDLLLVADTAAARQAEQNSFTKGKVLTEEELDRLNVAINARKLALQQRSAYDNLQLLQHFLEYSKEVKQQKLLDLQHQLQTLDNDMSLVASQLQPSATIDIDGHDSSPHEAAALSAELLRARLLEASAADDEQLGHADAASSLFGEVQPPTEMGTSLLRNALSGSLTPERGSSQLLLSSATPAPPADSVPLVAPTQGQQPVAIPTQHRGEEHDHPLAVGNHMTASENPDSIQPAVPRTPYLSPPAADSSEHASVHHMQHSQHGRPFREGTSIPEASFPPQSSPVSSNSQQSHQQQQNHLCDHHHHHHHHHHHQQQQQQQQWQQHQQQQQQPLLQNHSHDHHHPQQPQNQHQQHQDAKAGTDKDDDLLREKRRRRFSAQLKDLQQCYLALRSSHAQCPSQLAHPAQPQADPAREQAPSNLSSVTEATPCDPADNASATEHRGSDAISPTPPRSPPLVQPLQRLSMQQSTTISDMDADTEPLALKDRQCLPVDSAAANVSAAAGKEVVVNDAPPSPAAPAPKRLRKGTPDGPVAPSGSEPDGLAEFSRMLSVFTHFGSLQVVAQVPRASVRQSSAILSSIEFDRDAQLFATAGVSKRICIFDFNRVMANPLETVHLPHAELSTRSKLSCVSWNKYLQSQLISSDYEGVVALWDVTTGQQLSEYEAHQKRIWTVDFGRTEPCHFVSGSDDGWVRMWSTHEQDSLLQIDMKANVCCVKYNPLVAHQIAVGCADHRLHLYDLRKPDHAVSILEGHKKAVAYVRYMSATEAVSASTDSTLRLWDLSTQECARTYQGHLNEKNFVGLSVDGEFLACGSENNEIFVYYKSLSKPIAQRDFAEPPISANAAQRQSATAAAAAEAGHFISAVCWKQGTNTLLAANSSGVVSICSLTHD